MSLAVVLVIMLCVMLPSKALRLSKNKSYKMLTHAHSTATGSPFSSSLIRPAGSRTLSWSFSKPLTVSFGGSFRENSWFKAGSVVRGLHMKAGDAGASSLIDSTISSSIQKISMAELDPETRTPVYIVDNEATARAALSVLHAHPNLTWACDTEVADIDVKKVGPVGNGKVICVSIYGGDSVDFGGGNSTLWINNDGESDGVLQYFKEWFESDKYRKVWHNYGFDRHVMYNEGIDCRGFAGDTMHMARLWDSSRDKATGGGAGYSLEALSTDPHLFPDDVAGKKFAKTKMKDLFGVARLKKDGEESKIKELPDLRVLQNDPSTRNQWIEYSARDAVATWWVGYRLRQELQKMPWQVESQQLPPINGKKANMYHFYDQYLKDFGEVLTDMERNGIKVDTNGHLKQAEQAARAERDRLENMFLEWAKDYCTESKHINIASSAQMQQLLFGEYEDYVLKSRERSFRIDKTPEEFEAEMQEVLKLNPYAQATAGEIKTLLKDRGLKLAGTKDELITRLLEFDKRLPNILQLSSEDLIEKCELRGIATDSISHERLAHEYLKSEFLNEGALLRKQAAETKKLAKLAALEQSKEALQAKAEASMLVNPYAQVGLNELKTILKERGLKQSGTKEEICIRLLNYDNRLPELLKLSSEELAEKCESRGLDCSNDHEEMARVYLASEFLSEGKLAAAEAKKLTKNEEGDALTVEAVETAPVNATMPKKYRDMIITTIGLTPTDFTPTGIPQVSASVLKKLSGQNVFGDEKDAVWGTAFDAFGGGEEGKRACRAIGALAAVGQVDTTIGNFLVPLQFLADKNQRIHCSLNLNTETGRLSSRRPNLQNQPALEKDQYKIRDAFIAEEGKTLIVADYGQLELRILAHISNCESMIDAFRKGGCFHSRTAVGMYDYIKEAVAKGEVMLEWDYSKGQPTVPLVKDTYGSERRKAKTLNFSIAYGKTVHGLAQDWGITPEAAQETLDAWYRDRPEVKQWQEKTMFFARKNGWVNTMMGRYRKLTDAMGRHGPAVGHALRAAINTPIQGSAADIVMLAMIKLWKSEVLKKLGWKLLLQIHDEVILEGPKESMQEAMEEVRSCMENPFDDVLKEMRVHLDVDAKSADSWYKAK